MPKCLFKRGRGTLIGGRVLNWRGHWVFSCTDSVIDSKGGTNWKPWPWGWVLIWRKALIRTWVLIWRNTVSSEVKFYKGRVHTVYKSGGNQSLEIIFCLSVCLISLKIVHWISRGITDYIVYHCTYWKLLLFITASLNTAFIIPYFCCIREKKINVISCWQNKPHHQG